MPKYVKNGREIFASKKAFKLFYEEQGYQLVKDSASSTAPVIVDEEPSAPVVDDFEDEEDEGVDLSLDGETPLAARVALLSYDQLKVKAKQLGIPKYSQTKFADLVVKVTDALEQSYAD